MIRSRLACTSLALLLAAASATAEKPRLKIAALPAPQLDGRLDDEVWKQAASFEMKRGEHVLATARLFRSGRDLYIGVHSELVPLGLGVRFNVTDPRTRRRIAILVSPFEMPRAPLSIWLERGRESAPLDATSCEARLEYGEERQYNFELRIPLDLLEIGRPAKEYGFDAELWNIRIGKPISYYPLVGEGMGATKGLAVLEGVPHWGEGAEAAEHPKHPALSLLVELRKRSEQEPKLDPISTANGIRTGRRAPAQLESIEKRLAALVKTYPDYPSLRAQLVRTLSGLNRPTDALAVLEGMRRDYPFLAVDQRQALTEAQLMREAGRYADALARLDERKEVLGNVRDYVRDRALLELLVVAQKLEEEYRAEEAKRDDLPRVKLETDRGVIVLELFEDDAPNTVANFISLVGQGFYDKTRFHWVAANGSVIGGDPNSRDDDEFNDGYGDAGYLIEAEPSRRLNLRYTVAMAGKRRDPRAQGSMFAINLSAAPSRDGEATVFGRIIEGFDVAKKIAYGDTLKKATVLRKRDHAYEVVKRP
ncbi:MAG: peptidylprolyl isomerase [Planctomycetota bacterium]|jgi:cyclophilin family peptidyl-prolyl cis-trans isomerase